MAQGEELGSCSVSVSCQAAYGVHSMQGAVYLSFGWFGGGFLLDLLWVAAVHNAHGRQCFSALIRLEKTQKKLSGGFNGGNEQKLVLCDVKMS